MLRSVFVVFVITYSVSYCQVIQSDSLVDYIKIKGDSIVRSSIDLDQVVLLPKMKHRNSDEIRKYLILKRKTLKIIEHKKKEK